MAVVVNFLRNAGMGHIGLWGRSMGAVTALRYCVAQQDYSIAGLVLDSPFRNLPLLIRELARDRGIPGFASSIAIHYIRRAIVAKDPLRHLQPEEVGLLPLGLPLLPVVKVHVAPICPLPLVPAIVLEPDEGLAGDLLPGQPRVLINVMDTGQLRLSVHLLALGRGHIMGRATVRTCVVTVAIEQIPSHWTKF